MLGDNYGRKKAVVWFAVLLTISILCPQIVLLPSLPISIEIKYIVYSIGQFFVGLLDNCLFCTAYIVLMELTTEKYNTSISNLNSYFYIIGELIVLVVYYFSQSWHLTNWFLGIFSLISTVLLIIFLPESPIWLISRNRYIEASNILKKVAKYNGKPYDYVQAILENKSVEKQLLTNKEEIIKKSKLFELKEITQMFLPKNNFIKSTVFFIIWAVIFLLYYGISLGISAFDHVDPYLMYFLSALAEFIGYTLCYLNDYLGRRKTMSCFLFITAITYGIIAFLSLNPSDNDNIFSTKSIFLMICGLLGKCSISGKIFVRFLKNSNFSSTSSIIVNFFFLN